MSPFLIMQALYKSSVDGKHYAIKSFHKSHLRKLRFAPSETAMTHVLRTMQTLDARHIELFLCEGYQNGSWELLVYEYVNNGNLEQWLHGAMQQYDFLTWDARIKILLGTTKALAYLHEGSQVDIGGCHSQEHGGVERDDEVTVLIDFTVLGTTLAMYVYFMQI
ncbi:receptor-like protein kinase [Trifolium pratense]|uniref:non-specific serine/threonine protein kinase n=1 Tax=Trifolium pratense TaxID=57577 RepID=A0A2K3NRR2_TRIPR|nr:receptor-like protein kinase [Trifolium pratense]